MSLKQASSVVLAELVSTLAVGLGVRAWRRWWVGDEACSMPGIERECVCVCVCVCLLSRAPLMGFIVRDDATSGVNRREGVAGKWREGAVACIPAAAWEEGTLTRRLSCLPLGNDRRH
jgi:hypothetical protein